MAKNNISYNLNTLTELQNSILQILKRRGDVEVADTACLASVPSLIQGLGNKSYVSQPVQTEIAKCGKLLTRFAVFSDIHCASPYSYPDTYKENNGYQNGLAAIRQYAKEAMSGELDFVVFCGDTLGPEGGSAEVYGALKTITDEWRSILLATNTPLYMIPGNHDSGCGIDVWEKVSDITSYSNDVVFLNSDKTCFYKEINGDLYIWFAVFNNKNFTYSDALFEWLFNLLDTNKYRTRVFLFTHWYDGTVDGFGWRYLNGKYINHGWSEEKTDQRFGKIKEYKNLIWISGHAHTDWKYEDKYPTIKVHSNNTARMVNVPSLKDNNQDVRISVYSNMVVVEPYSNNKRMDTKIYYIGNGYTEDVIFVNYYLTGVSSSNTKTSVAQGNGFTTKLSLLPYYSNMQVSVYMNGVDITSTAYNSNTGEINIASVTGTLDITAKAVSDVKTYSVSYTLQGYKSNGLVEIPEDKSFEIILTPESGFTSNPTSINVSIDGLGSVITNGYEDSDYIDIQTIDGITKLLFTSEMAVGDIQVSATASKSISITYELDNGAIVDNKPTTINYGDSYTANVSLSDGTEPVVQVLINNIDFSDNYYKNGVINIPYVTADVKIVVQDLDSKYSDCVKMVFDVTDTSVPTQLLYSTYNVAKYISQMVVDGNVVDSAATYQFEKTGKHTVYVKLVGNVFHSNFARECGQLTLVRVPPTITGYSAALFRGCPQLEEVVLNCTASISLSTYVFYDNPKLQKVVLGSGITGIAQNNFNSECVAFSELYIYNPTSFAWTASAVSSSGILHFVEGADIESVKNKLTKFTFVADL